MAAGTAIPAPAELVRRARAMIPALAERAAAVYTSSPFGRFLADINAGRQHISNQYEANGRNWGAAMLGVGDNRDPRL